VFIGPNPSGPTTPRTASAVPSAARSIFRCNICNYSQLCRKQIPAVSAFVQRNGEYSPVMDSRLQGRVRNTRGPLEFERNAPRRGEPARCTRPGTSGILSARPAALDWRNHP
jgi:hypothetical protein